MSDEIDHVLELACSVSPGRPLSTYPPDLPLPMQRDIVEEARRRAEPRLTLPTRLTVRWVDGGRDANLHHGEIHHERGGVVIYLRVDLLPGQLAQNALHELQHAADTQLILAHPGTRAEFERRAIDFANLCMRTWPWFR